MGLSLNGTAWQDGNYMSGTFFSGVAFDGTFTGTKKGAPVGVGGIAELPEAARAPLEAGRTPLEAGASSGPGAAMLAGIAAAVLAGVASIGGAAWYARRRYSS